MKRTFLIWFLMSWCMGAVCAKQHIRDVFKAMPDSIMPLLTANDRADFIDFMDSKMKAVVTNKLEGKSEMTVLGDDFLSIEMSSQSTWQMKLLATSDTTSVLCVVRTVKATEADSNITFYNPVTWEELDAKTFLPFIAAIQPDELKSGMLNIIFRQAELMADKSQIRFTTRMFKKEQLESGDEQLNPVSRVMLCEWRNTRFEVVDTPNE